MPSPTHDECERLLDTADHGVLATVDADGRPHAVPVCFVVLDGQIAVPVDTVKPKTTTSLQRMRNVETTGGAALLVDHWDNDDWTKLWWVRADLVHTAATDDDRSAAADSLRDRYTQYRDHQFADILTMSIERLTGWSAR